MEIISVQEMKLNFRLSVILIIFIVSSFIDFSYLWQNRVLSEIATAAADELTAKQKNLINSAQQKIRERNYQSAIFKLEANLKSDNSVQIPATYLTLGNAYWYFNKEEAAIEAYKKGLTIEPDNIELLNNLGKIYYERGNYKTAATYIARLQNKQPDRRNIQFAGSCYLSVGDYLTAQKIFENGVARFPDAVEFRKGVIQSLINLEQFDAALKICKNTIIQFPDDRELLLLGGQLYIHAKQYDDAIIALEKIVSMNYGTTGVYQSLCDLYGYKGMCDESAKYYELSLKAGKPDERSVLMLAGAYYANHQYRQALNYANQAIDLKKNPDAFLLKAKIQIAQKNYSDALTALENLKKLRTQPAEYYFLTGVCNIMLKKYAAAELAFQQAKLYDDYKSKSLAYLGELKYYQSDLRSAIEYYTDAYKIEPENQNYRKMINYLSGLTCFMQ